MLKNVLGILLLSAFVFGRAQAPNASEALNTMIEKGMVDWHIPGLAVVVVQDGKVRFQQNYGIRDVATKASVNDSTLFAMGSTTKALVAMGLGILVDEGKITWEDKVVSHLPYFRLSEPYVTANAEIKDLLTHRLGIGNTDALWIMDSTSTEKTISRLQYAPMPFLTGRLHLSKYHVCCRW